jgi:hypothetical protein
METIGDLLTITKEGKVGVGTRDPDSYLTIGVPSPSEADKPHSPAYANIKNGKHELRLGVEDNATILSAETNSDLVLRTNKAARLTITKDGKVDIGATTIQPDGQLVSPMWKVTDVDGMNRQKFVSKGGSLVFFVSATFICRLAPTEMRLRIHVATPAGVVLAKMEHTVYTVGCVSWPTFVLTPPNRLPAGELRLWYDYDNMEKLDKYCGISVTILELPF